MYNEFIRVECRANRKLIYEDYFTFAQKGKIKTLNPNDGSKVSILMIGLDSISRLNLYRQLPKTVRFLDDVGAYEMLGYNKVGENTFPNLVPVLTGLSVKELKKTCWKTRSEVFDACTFIWDYFKKEGYKTGFGEDTSIIGTFNHVKRGFKKQPTDYYFNVFSRVAEDDIGHESWGVTRVCLGSRLTSDVLIDGVRSFVFNLKKLLSFGFFWGNALSHDYLNLPKLGDDTHLKLFTDLKNGGILNKTVVIFLSDHGMRWGAFRNTYHGYLEERLPFLYILIPNWFQKRFPQAVHNLKYNQHSLTTPFDLHATLADLLNLEVIKNDNLQKRSKSVIKRGISLFSPISEERTCKDAEIPEKWCTCLQSFNEKPNNRLVVICAYKMIRYLNRMLRKYEQCSKLHLNKVIKSYAEKVSISKNDHKDRTISAVTDYIIVIETVPGFALFEATIRHDPLTDKETILPPISRINYYGNQSSCISNYELKLYCYCSHLL